jgi:hypothetical protein
LCSLTSTTASHQPWQEVTCALSPQGAAGGARLAEGSAASFDALRAAQAAYGHLAAKLATLEVRPPACVTVAVATEL